MEVGKQVYSTTLTPTLTNHKPELIVAITPFEALCCFRPLREIIYFIDSCAPFRRLLGDEVVAMIRETLDVDDQYHHKGGAAPERVKQVLRACMERLYATPEATNHSLVEELCGLVSSPTFAASLPAHTNPDGKGIRCLCQNQ